MDTGPFFSGSLTVQSNANLVVPKGVAVKLGDFGGGAFLFDTDLLQMSAMWRGRFVDINPREDFRFENRHSVNTPVDFSNPAVQGWSRSGEFKDPRDSQFGPVPRSVGRYRGLYVHGQRVAFRYDVGETEILDSPWLLSSNGLEVYTRTLQLESASNELQLLLFELTDETAELKSIGDRELLVYEQSGGRVIAVGLESTGEDDDTKAELVVGEKGRAVVSLAAHENKLTTRVAIYHGDIDQLENFADLLTSLPTRFDFEQFTSGGPARWEPPITTSGARGEEKGAFTVDTIGVPESNPWNALMYLSGHDFFDNGDAAVCTGHGDVWLVKGIDDELQQTVWKRYATGLLNPLGLRIVKDIVYVTCHDQLLCLHDFNDDDEADYYECFNNDCHVTGFHHRFAAGLEVDADGNFYYLRCTNEGRVPHGGTVLKVSKDGDKLDVFATGLRNPNGMSLSPLGFATFGDQQGGWVPATPIHIVRQGKFYGYIPSHHGDEPPIKFEPPLCWIPHSVDNSAGGQAWVPDDRWGLAGQMVHLSYGKCALFLTMMEKRGEIYQGGVVKLPVAFQSGVMRARFRATDGQLYVSGLRGWQTSAAKNGCFQRVRYRQEPLRLPIGLKVKKDGIEVTFSDELDPETANDPDNFSIEQWNYRWTRNYGSPDYSVANPKKMGRDEVDVYDAKLLGDGKTVFLELEDVQPVMQMGITYSLKTADGIAIKDTIYNTINVVD